MFNACVSFAQNWRLMQFYPCRRICHCNLPPYIMGTIYILLSFYLGPVVGKFCMELAIKKAKEAGIGWVVACGKIKEHLFSLTSQLKHIDLLIISG